MPVTADTLAISVVVPSYRRPERLGRCLEGLARQSRPAGEVVVACRRDDDATRAVVANGGPSVREALVEEPGVLAAMAKGVAATTGEVVAFTDDDAVARPGWLEGLSRHFADPQVGGVGGRDIVHSLPDPERQCDVDVGRITPWGKLIGNHHLGCGPARDAMVLKGVNMAFRRGALALPRRLHGSGAQVHFEVATGLWAVRRGWRLVYDPALVVDHYPGPRYDGDRRDHPDPQAFVDAAYNLVVCIVSIEPQLLWRRAAYGVLIGDEMTPGLARAGVAAARREWPVVRQLPASLRGQVAGIRDARRRQLVEMVPAAPG